MTPAWAENVFLPILILLLDFATGLERVHAKNIVLVVSEVQILPHLDMTIRERNARFQIVAAGGLFLRPPLQPSSLRVRWKSDDFGEITSRGDVI